MSLSLDRKSDMAACCHDNSVAMHSESVGYRRCLDCGEVFDLFEGEKGFPSST